MTKEDEAGPAKTTSLERVNAESTIAPAYEVTIRDLIYTVRGVQVMLDSDLAMLYGGETQAINQGVRRNMERFPERFCFQLPREEFDSLRSQFVTSNEEGGRGGRRYLPNVFT